MNAAAKAGVLLATAAFLVWGAPSHRAGAEETVAEAGGLVRRIAHVRLCIMLEKKDPVPARALRCILEHEPLIFESPVLLERRLETARLTGAESADELTHCIRYYFLERKMDRLVQRYAREALLLLSKGRTPSEEDYERNPVLWACRHIARSRRMERALKRLPSPR